jgi:streptogramin lyase
MRTTRMGALAVLAAALALVAGAACGGDGGGLVEVEGIPEVTTPLADAEEASIELAGGPDWSTSHGGYVWIKRDNGMVTRIDPRTNKPTGDVIADTKSEEQFGQTLCQGIGSGGGAIWSCSGSDVVRIDPEQLKVTKSLPVAKVFDSGRLVFAADKIWVLTGEGDRLVGIDPSTSSVGTTVELPIPCNELGPGPEMVWAICPRDGKVLGIDPAGASVDVELELENPTVAFATERDLWVGSAGDLVRFDLEKLEPVAQFASLDPTSEGDLRVDGANVWVRSPAGFLYRIDAATNAVAERIEPPSPLSGGAVLVEAGSVWATAYNDNLLVRLRAKT